MRSLRLCIVGNLLGRNPGYVTTQGQVVADLFELSGYEVTSVSSRINRLYRLADIVSTVLKKRKKIDVLIVEVYSGIGFLLADSVSFISKYFQIPTVHVLHGGGLPEFIGRFPGWSMRVLNRADLVVTPSPFLARAVHEYGLSSQIVPNVIDLDGYGYRQRKNIKPKLIWMRSFHPTYNPFMALQVFDIVRSAYPDATMVMAGVDKGLEGDVKKAASEMGLGDAVRFPGFLDMRAKITEFSNADIYLNTNKIDNMPVSVIEACAMGLPVVATNVGGLLDLITDGSTGLLVPDGDAEAMAAAVCRLLNDPELTIQISENGRQLAERSSWESVKNQWSDVFAEVLDGMGHPAPRETTVESI